MSIKTFALSAALATSLIAPLALALDVVPANNVTGFITAADATAGTIVVDGMTFRGVSPLTINELTVGNEVDIAYVPEAGRLKALAVEPIEMEATGELVD